MANQEAVRRVTSPDYIGTFEAVGNDLDDNVRVTLGVRGEVRSIVVSELVAGTKVETGLREAVFEAAARAEASRVLNELALIGAIDPDNPAPADKTLAPLPGPIADQLVVRPPDEQATHFARYVNAGGLEPIEAPGTRRSTSDNGYLSLTFNDRGQLAGLEADQEWLYAVSPDRLNNALKEAVGS